MTHLYIFRELSEVCILHESLFFHQVSDIETSNSLLCNCVNATPKIYTAAYVLWSLVRTRQCFNTTTMLPRTYFDRSYVYVDDTNLTWNDKQLFRGISCPNNLHNNTDKRFSFFHFAWLGCCFNSLPFALFDNCRTWSSLFAQHNFLLK